VDFTNKHWGFAIKHEFGDSCSWAASQKKTCHSSVSHRKMEFARSLKRAVAGQKKSTVRWSIMLGRT
jgi:hypothetical protein